MVGSESYWVSVKRIEGDRQSRFHSLGELDAFQRVCGAAFLIALVVTSCVLLFRLDSGGFTPISDEANQIHGAQLAFREWPLIGDFNTANLYGNQPSHHPGPLPWYTMAPWVIVLGPQLGAWLFALVWNGINICLASYLAFRVKGFKAGVVTATSVVVAVSVAIPGQLGSSFFQFTPLATLSVVIIGCWALALGDTFAFPFVAVAATYVIQAATVCFPLVVICGAVSAICGWRMFKGSVPSRTQRFQLYIGAFLIVLLWMPPIIDQLFGSGNLGRLLRIRITHAGLSGSLDALTRIGAPWTQTWHDRPEVIIASTVVLIVSLLKVLQGNFFVDRAAIAMLVALLAGSVVIGWLIPSDDVEATHYLWTAFVTAFLIQTMITEISINKGRESIKRVVGALCMFVFIAASLNVLAQPPRLTYQDRASTNAIPVFLSSIKHAIPVGQIRVGSRGGFMVSHSLPGLLIHLQDQGYEAMWGDVTGEPTVPTIMIIRGQPTELQAGHAMATYRPQVALGVYRDLPMLLRQWVLDHGSFQLAPLSEHLLSNTLDGQAPQVCVQQLMKDPSPILSMSPDVLVGLYDAGLVKSPQLPVDLSDQLDSWLGSQPLTIVRLVDRGTDAELAFSSSECS